MFSLVSIDTMDQITLSNLKNL